MNTNHVRLNSSIRALLAALLVVSILLTGCSSQGSSVLSHDLSEPVNGAKTASFDIRTDTGNLTIDGRTTGEEVLASGTLQYLESQGLPAQTVTSSNGQATLTLSAKDNKKTGGFRFPWEACGPATDWQIHLNPGLPADITAHSGGGNVNLDLAGTAVTRIAADTGGGNMEIVLPENAADLDIAAKTGGGDVMVKVGSGTSGSSIINASSGAGNVTVQLPEGLAARIHMTSGMGKVMAGDRFSKIDTDTYQTPDYDNAANKVEITLSSGAGNVSVNPK